MTTKFSMRDALAAIHEAYGNLEGALVDEMSVGPRSEVMLVVAPLLWRGGRAYHAAPITIHFGGIQDFPRVEAAFQELMSQESEIGFLGPDPDRPVRRDGLYSIKYEAERSDFEFRFRCSSVQATRVPDRG